MFRQQFGKAPSGARLAAIQQSSHYRDGKFQNIHHTPSLTEGYSMPGVLYNFMFRRFPRTRPAAPIPSVKTHLKQLPAEQNLLVWFGHSSYYIQLNGKRFLIDPVFSGNASPIPNSNKSFKGSDIYTAADMPQIDYLLITHDHYDHLDYPTVLELRTKISHIVCGLGVGAHFEYWGFDSGLILEKDWDEQLNIDHDFNLFTAPARHFSGRGFKRNNTLWLSFILQSADLSLYLGGDSGYDTHFTDIGNKFGGFDLALLDNGQYNKAWQTIHMLPEEGLKAARDLGAQRLFPVHSSKFKLSTHPWDDPLKTITSLNHIQDQPLDIITPKIGEVVYLNNKEQTFSAWWEEIG